MSWRSTSTIWWRCANCARRAPGRDCRSLLDHVPGREGQAVSDPYYSGPEGFLTTWSDVTAGADGLLTKILAPA